MVCVADMHIPNKVWMVSESKELNTSLIKNFLIQSYFNLQKILIYIITLYNNLYSNTVTDHILKK